LAVNQLPVVTTPKAVQPVRDVKSAQRAFFQAALGQVQAAPATTPVVRAEPVRSARVASPDPADGRRILPPGSLLDIKI
jgi:hypothetical protein